MTDEEKKELQKQKAREYQRVYRAAHQDKLNAQKREYNKRHREQRTQYEIEHKAEAAERRRKYETIHKEEISEKNKWLRYHGKIKTIKAVYLGADNTDVIRLRKHLEESGESTSSYIKRLIKEDLEKRGYKGWLNPKRGKGQ